MQCGLSFFAHDCRIDIKEAGEEKIWAAKANINYSICRSTVARTGHHWLLHCLGR
jgi:hypothetical protein